MTIKIAIKCLQTALLLICETNIPLTLKKPKLQCNLDSALFCRLVFVKPSYQRENIDIGYVLNPIRLYLMFSLTPTAYTYLCESHGAFETFLSLFTYFLFTEYWAYIKISNKFQMHADASACNPYPSPCILKDDEKECM